MERLKRIGRILRGDRLTEYGKRQTLLWGLGISVVWAIVATAMATSVAAPLIAAWMFLAAYWGHVWVSFDAPNPCPGPRNVYRSPSGEIALMICHGCESWGLIVRGEDKGSGSGHQSLIDRLRLVADQARDLPHLGAELRQAAEGVEQDGSLKMNERYAAMSDAPEDAMTSLAEAIQVAAEEFDRLNVPEVQAVLVDAAEYAEFTAWRDRKEGEVDGSAA